MTSFIEVTPGIRRCGLPLINGSLELSDLSPTELTFLLIYQRVGRVELSPGSVIRANLVEQLLRSDGPIGSGVARMRRVHVKNVIFLDSLDLADSTVAPAVLFQSCVFRAGPVGIDLSRSHLSDVRFERCGFETGIRVENASIRSNLILDECVLAGPLNCTQIRVGANLLLLNTVVHSANEQKVLFDSAEISGYLSIDNVRSSAPFFFRQALIRGKALVTNSVFAFDSEGSLVLDMSNFDMDLVIGPRVQIGSSLGIQGVSVGSSIIVDGVGGVGAGFATIRAQRARANGGIVFDGKTVFALGADLSGVRAETLEFRNVFLGGTVSIDGAAIAQDVNFGPMFRTLGPEVRLLGSHIGGQLVVDSPPDAELFPWAINAESIEVGDAVFIDRMHPDSILLLSGARLGGLLVDPTSLPRISIVGTTYGYVRHLSGDALPGSDGLRILRREWRTFSIAPYVTMARWYRAQGQDAESNFLFVAGEKDARSTRNRASRAMGKVLEITVGYGYEPLRAFAWLGVLVISAVVIFALLYTGRIFGVSLFDVESNGVFANGLLNGSLFNPLTYAIATIVPVAGEWLSSWRPVSPIAEHITLIFRGLGWLLTTAVVAGVLSRIQRR